MFNPETVIHNHYRIVRPIENATSETYEAFDLTQQQSVKVQAWAVPDSSTLERLRHAANARQRSRHPSLPAMIEHFAEGDTYIAVTEWVDGPTLAERLQAQGAPFSPAEVLRWAEQLLNALMVLHRQVPVLAHGDIRAANLIETPSGVIELLGTNLYAVGGTSAPTEEKDIYDTCALIYHLLTEVKAPTLAGRRERGFLPTADMLNPTVPPSLGRLLAQGLSEQSEDRFKSAFALQNALARVKEHLNQDETVIAPPPSRTPPSLATKLQQRQNVPTNDTGDTESAAPADNPVADTQPDGAPLPTDTATTETPGLLESLMADVAEPATEENSASVTEKTTSFPEPPAFEVEPEPIVPETLANETPPENVPNSAPDPFKLSFDASEPPPHPEAERPSEPPPTGESAPPPPSSPGTLNRLWFALGVGCMGAILCVCCGLIGAVAYQWDTIVQDIEASDIFEEDSDPESVPANPGSGSNGNIGNNEAGITVSVFDIKIGDCFAEPSENEFIEEITLTDCDEPHDNEVYAFGQYPADEDAEFPAEDDLDDFANDFCTAEFEDYVGIPYSDSIYYFTYFQPTEMSWEDGDREIVCILYDLDGKTEGSKQNSQE